MSKHVVECTFSLLTSAPKLDFLPQVHKVIPGTLADRDGRIQKGDRVLSINGRSTKGVTHREALSILKVINGKIDLKRIIK